jgi:haloalkane dehalogenase
MLDNTPKAYLKDLNSHFAEVNGFSMHYIDQGAGDTFLFLHGNPTYSYIWRKIIPLLSENARCVAPDLIGMGYSDKPHINYHFSEHYNYITGFINKLQLSEITLVLHDWGSAIGLYYAMNNPGKIKAIVFMESLIKPWEWKNLKWNHKLGFRLLRTPLIGEFMIYRLNAFINLFLPGLIYRKLSKNEMKAYKAPFRKIQSRKPMLQWARQIPINGKPKQIYEIVQEYNHFLRNAIIPKLLIYSLPGAMINKADVDWCNKHLKNLESYYVGKGYHFIQEDYPEQIAAKIKTWRMKIENPEHQTL